MVELLVVLFLIGILLSICFPVYSIIVRRAEEVVCSTHRAQLNTITNLDFQVPPEKDLRDYLNQSGQYQCPSGGFYIYLGNRVGCSIHDDVEEHVVCTYGRQVLEEDYHRYLESVPEHHPIMTWTDFIGDDKDMCPSSGVISYYSGSVVCSLHHSGADDDEDDGRVPFL